MFSSIFLSKNQKLVKKWTKEHEVMIQLTHKTLAEYSKNNHEKAKKFLSKLTHITVDHVTDENIEFFKLLRDDTRLSPEKEKHTKEFITSFTETRLELMGFLTQYTKKSTPLDENFFITLNQIADVLTERIEFEEKNLYHLLESDEDVLWENFKRKL